MLEEGFDEASDFGGGFAFFGEGEEEAFFFRVVCGRVEEEVGGDVDFAWAEFLVVFEVSDEGVHMD